jgi:hypothetical protein
MRKLEIFESSVRSTGDIAGVFEFDGNVAYFYLYNTSAADKHKIIGAIRMVAGMPDFEEDDLAICWDQTESKVGLRIRGSLWAAFDAKTSEAYGGNYRAGGKPEIPASILALF